MLALWRAAGCRLGWTQGEMYFVCQHRHPNPLCCPHSHGSFGQVLVFSTAFLLPLLSPNSSPKLGDSKKPWCSTGICIHQTSICALQPSSTDPALPSWLGSEVSLPLPVIPKGPI